MKHNKKILTIIIVLTLVVIIGIGVFIKIKLANSGITKQNTNNNDLKESYTSSSSQTINGTQYTIKYISNMVNNAAEDDDHDIWLYTNIQMNGKKLNYTWLSNKCQLYGDSNACVGKAATNSFLFSMINNANNKYMVVRSRIIKTVNNANPIYIAEKSAYITTVFIENENDMQMIFEVPTPRYEKLKLSSTYKSFTFEDNVAIDTANDYIYYLELSPTAENMINIHKVSFSGTTVNDVVEATRSGSIDLS